MAALGRSCPGIPAGPALEFPQALAAAPDRHGLPGVARDDSQPGAAGRGYLQPPAVMLAGNRSDGADGCGSSGARLQSSFDVAALAALGSYNESLTVAPVGSFTNAAHPRGLHQQQSHSQ